MSIDRSQADHACLSKASMRPVRRAHIALSMPYVKIPKYH